MGLRSWVLAALLVALTVSIPVLVLVRLDRVGAASRAVGSSWRRLGSWRVVARESPRTGIGLGTRWLVILLAQLLAILTVLVLANREMRFYMTWGDLFGDGAASSTAQLSQAGPALPSDPARPEAPLTTTQRTPSGATLVRMVVRGQVSGVNSEVLVWLPPAYFEEPQQSFPVLFMLSGSPGTPEGVYTQFGFDKHAADSITSGDTKPFIAVFPAVMTHPPRDTECLDIPNGPRSESWLATDVPAAVDAAVRATPDRSRWSVAGYSTGGLCAANLLLRHRDRFGAAASIGGYFHPWAQPSEGDLFGGSEEFRQSVSPLWQFQHATPQPTKLLIVSSTRDSSSWDGKTDRDGDSRAMIDAAARWPGTGKIVMNRGGHGFQTYEAVFPQVLAWLGQNGGL